VGGGGVWCGGIILLFLPLLMNRLIDRSIDQLSEYWYYYFDCGGWACFFREEALLFQPISEAFHAISFELIR
jgi:hypothetical protein